MKKQFPIRAKIADGRVTNGIVWLEIHQRDGGYYLYQFKDIRLPPKWDLFTDDLEDLLRDCRENWGVEDEHWETVDSSNAL